MGKGQSRVQGRPGGGVREKRANPSALVHTVELEQLDHLILSATQNVDLAALLYKEFGYLPRYTQPCT